MRKKPEVTDRAHLLEDTSCNAYPNRIFEIINTESKSWRETRVMIAIARSSIGYNQLRKRTRLEEMCKIAQLRSDHFLETAQDLKERKIIHFSKDGPNYYDVGLNSKLFGDLDAQVLISLNRQKSQEQELQKKERNRPRLRAQKATAQGPLGPGSGPERPQAGHESVYNASESQDNLDPKNKDKNKDLKETPKQSPDDDDFGKVLSLFKERWSNLAAKSVYKEEETLLELLSTYPSEIPYIYQELKTMDQTKKTRYGGSFSTSIGWLATSWKGIRKEYLVEIEIKKKHQEQEDLRSLQRLAEEEEKQAEYDRYQKRFEVMRDEFYKAFPTEKEQILAYEKYRNRSFKNLQMKHTQDSAIENWYKIRYSYAENELELSREVVK